MVSQMRRRGPAYKCPARGPVTVMALNGHSSTIEYGSCWFFQAQGMTYLWWPWSLRSSVVKPLIIHSLRLIKSASKFNVRAWVDRASRLIRLLWTTLTQAEWAGLNNWRQQGTDTGIQWKAIDWFPLGEGGGSKSPFMTLTCCFSSATSMYSIVARSTQ